MKFLATWILLSLLLVTAACAPTRDKGVAPVKQNVNGLARITTSEENSAKVFAAAAVHCDDGKSCSPSIGMIVAIEGKSILQCTGFLISDTVVATSAQCIPQNLKSSDSCSGQIQIVFPESGGFESVHADCSQVLSVFSEQETRDAPNMNFAFFSIDKKIDRPALQIDSSGISNNMKLQIQKVTSVSSSRSDVVGHVEIETCKATQKSLLRPVVTFNGCIIGEGNSGAPLIDENGRVRAIAQGFKSEKDNGGLNFATNYACVSLPTSEVTEIDPECK